MRSIRRHGAMVVVFALAMVTATGCGGGPSGNTNTNDNSGGSGGVQAGDCAQTSADALVTVDDDDASDLLVTAVTSDCDELAVFSGDGQDVRQAVIVTRDTELTAEFDSNGQLVAARTSEDESLSVNYNDGLSYARVTYEDDDTTASTLVSVSRDEAEQRNPAQNSTQQQICPSLEQFARLVRDACESDDPPPYCDGGFARARAAAEKLCSGTNLQRVDAIGGLSVDQQRERLPLGIEGFATTRAAAGGGTTIILSSAAFGGLPPYEIRWQQAAGESAALTQLPGGAAIADSSSSNGRFGFQVGVSDAAGQQASANVEVELGDSGFAGVVIQASTLTPGVGETVTFTVSGTDQRMAAGASPTPSSFWDFGDGERDGGRTVEHTYARTGAFQATVAVAVEDEILTDTVQIVVGGASVEALDTDLRLRINIGDPAFLTVGQQRQVTAEFLGAIGGAEVAIGIVDGFDVGSLGGSGLVEENFVLGTTADLTAVAPGVVTLGAVAIDAAGRLAEATLQVPVCDDQSGLLVLIDGPEVLAVGESGTFEAVGASCRGEVSGLTFNWSTDNNNAVLTDPTSSETDVTPTAPGPLVLRLDVTDSSGARASATLGVFVEASGLSDLFVEFLGPFSIPLDLEVPLAAFVSGSRGAVFCSWRLDGNGSTSPIQISDSFSCDASVFAGSAGCVTGELFIEDSLGGVGSAAVEICADPNFELPGESCDSNGVCDETCPFLDPDCLQDEFCVSGDFLCFSQCPSDSDCNSCGLDGVCVFLCPDGDDPDCVQGVCVDGDGVCDFGCPSVDADCGAVEIAACDLTFACDPDCPEDPECNQNCDLTFACDPNCPDDPECNQNCDLTFACDPDCPDDPECNQNCDVTFACDPGCPDDPECVDLCDVTPNCDPNCTLDPECIALCDLTFACDPDCPGDPECVALCDLTFDCDPICPGDPDCD